jgi:DNA-binding MarR family transcriptional regulator
MAVVAMARQDEHITTPDPAAVAGRLRLPVTRLARILRQQDQLGLTPTMTAALATIGREGPLTLGALAASEQVSPPTITRVVGKLEAAGLVRRRPDAADGRVTRVELSAAGRRQLDAGRTRRTAWLATRLRDLPPEDLVRLEEAAAVLERLTSAPLPESTS